MRAILSLDQSLSSTGFALFGESLIASGAWPLCDGVDDRDRGFLELFGHLDRLHKGHGLIAILHEEPLLMRIDKTPKLIGLYGLVAVIELFGKSRKIPVVSYEARSWRSSFFSKAERAALKGKDWKRPAVERARQLGQNPTSHDEAEAFAILDHHLIKRKITPPWRAGAPMLEPVA
jgi:hypothetical protein